MTELLPAFAASRWLVLGVMLLTHVLFHTFKGGEHCVADSTLKVRFFFNNIWFFFQSGLNTKV
jgi:hypothetical protein